MHKMSIYMLTIKETRTSSTNEVYKEITFPLYIPA